MAGGMTRPPASVLEGMPTGIPAGALAAILAAGLAACDGADSAPPTAPPAAPPPAPVPPPAPSPAFSVSFGEKALDVREGESLNVSVRYEVRELATPVELGVTVSGEGAGETDYELSPTAITIPAGEDLAGEAALVVTALEDLLFTEGGETLSLEFTPPSGGMEATLGDPLEITLLDAAVSPCPGVRVAGLPWREQGSLFQGIPNMLATTLTLDLDGAASGTRLELLSPYLDVGAFGSIQQSVSAFGINRWGVRRDAGSIVHEMEVNWSGEGWFKEDEEASLDLAFLGGGCAGEPVASCTSEGCEIIP